MNNCLFENANCDLKVKLFSWISEDSNGYFIDLKVTRKDVLRLMEIGVTPIYKDSGDFVIRVHISNTTNITLNGIRVKDLTNPVLCSIEPEKLRIKEICLGKYSEKTRAKRECYAIKMFFNIPVRINNMA